MKVCPYCLMRPVMLRGKTCEDPSCRRLHLRLTHRRYCQQYRALPSEVRPAKVGPANPRHWENWECPYYDDGTPDSCLELAAKLGRAQVPCKGCLNYSHRLARKVAAE